jgi:hypothetical protein
MIPNPDDYAIRVRASYGTHGFRFSKVGGLVAAMAAAKGLSLCAAGHCGHRTNIWVGLMALDLDQRRRSRWMA